MVENNRESGEYCQLMFNHYFKESVLSLVNRICDSERLTPKLTLDGKFEDITFNQRDQGLVVKAIMYKGEAEIKETRRALQLEVQNAKTAEQPPTSYRPKEIQIIILGELLYNGVITKATRTLLHQQL